MPQISIALQRQLTAESAKRYSTAESIKSVEASPSDPANEILEVVYNIRTHTFRTCYRSALLTKEPDNVPLVEMAANVPPLLVDGRMQVVQIPKWKTKVGFLWRKSDGKFTKVRERVVRLPSWVWISRNLHGKFNELWVENV
ncbi:hypothetical protein D0Z07_6853 [Hyphodiscus hymeniophilus]|uniref:Uncharacterized protein n=1 Tax=Hyphodiscus hymeniophilus TaxID=353542 RepID=A0A9P6VGE9_9HELO|nr:hypothetical protein D0Z07_6853 [Hyphodiscus hymeniophilus]